MTYLYFFISLLLLSQCSSPTEPLTKVHITSPQGLTQTVTTKEKLSAFDSEEIFFQPYQKVVRVFGKNEEKQVLTAYYPSGHIHQLLECQKNRACGKFKEWWPNGMLKIEATISSGLPDLNAEDSWIFDGLSKAYNEEGQLEARFFYKEGTLEGKAEVFYPSGSNRETFFYVNGLLEGTYQGFYPNGALKKAHLYKKGIQSGPCISYWQNSKESSKEEFEAGLLKKGIYFDEKGIVLQKIQDGEGHKVLWSDDGSCCYIEHIKGCPQGKVSFFNQNGIKQHVYHQLNGLKHGEEIFYNEDSGFTEISIHWNHGVIHGKITTWTPEGAIESEREMANNKKEGVLTCRYPNGDISLIEEYSQDKLIRGQYFKPGSSFVFSEVEKGKGIAHIFNSQGKLQHRIIYEKGEPIE